MKSVIKQDTAGYFMEGTRYNYRPEANTGFAVGQEVNAFRFSIQSVKFYVIYTGPDQKEIWRRAEANAGTKKADDLNTFKGF